jgi:citrate synthase
MSIVKAGLEGVIAAETRLSRVDGQKGELIIGGYALEEFAGRATFEETIGLLWQGEIPTPEAHTALRTRLAEKRDLPAATLRLLESAAESGVSGMDALRMAAGSLSLSVPEELELLEQAEYVVAMFPTIVAAFWRLRNGQAPIAPRADLSHAANYLYMLTGETPHPDQTRALETYLNTVSDHGLNASTFTARVIISTQSDLISAITGAVGALKGPLHGGAPGPALDMVFEIGSAERAETVLREKLERGERLMGFGHRVYKVRDPRADVLAEAANLLYQEAGDRKLYELVRVVEAKAIELLEEYKPGRRLQTNVEFYTALLLHGLNLPTDLFTPTFAIGRVVGWVAHCLEQAATGRIIRPESVYVGEVGRTWHHPEPA